jgi:RNA polymerase sigma factor for flagellar operon FliA
MKTHPESRQATATPIPVKEQTMARPRQVTRRARPALDENETRRLWMEYREGPTEQLRNVLMERYLPLVKYNAERIHTKLPDEVDVEDLMQAGIFGLMDAIDAFDMERGVKVETYCAPRIRGAILDELRKADVAGRDTRRRQRMIAEVERTLAAENEGDVDAANVAGRMNIDVETLHRWKAAAHRTRHVSLEKRLAGFDGEGPTIGEMVPDSDAENVDDKLDFETESAAMRREFQRLDDRERTVLMLYYYEELKLREIAEVLGVTESRVSQIRTKALQTLRARLRPLREDA